MSRLIASSRELIAPTILGDASPNDALIVSAALLSGCKVLHSEDMQDGQVIERLLAIRKSVRWVVKIQTISTSAPYRASSASDVSRRIGSACACATSNLSKGSGRLRDEARSLRAAAGAQPQTAYRSCRTAGKHVLGSQPAGDDIWQGWRRRSCRIDGIGDNL
jgi:hypothetical protein